MDHLSRADEPVKSASARWLEGAALLVPLDEHRRRTDVRHVAKGIILVAEHLARLGLTDAHRFCSIV
jgi:hypothetical protein